MARQKQYPETHSIVFLGTVCFGDTPEGFCRRHYPGIDSRFGAQV